MKICLDAGHFGETNQYTLKNGTVRYESKTVWKLHNRLKSELIKSGADVVCTRDSQENDMALEERGKTAKGCDFFLSLHTNGGAKSADYPLACCCVDGSSDNIGLKLADAVGGIMQTKQKARIWKRDYFTGSGDMILSADDPCFGKRLYDKDYYGVLRGCTSVGTPGVLLECSFHSNLDIAEWLESEENLDALAKTLAKVIVDHFKEKESPTNWESKYYEVKDKYDRLVCGLEELLNKMKADGDLH